MCTSIPANSAKAARSSRSLGGLFKHAVHIRWNVAFGDKTLAPAGQQNHRRGGRIVLDRAGDLAAIDIGHAEIGDHDRETLISLFAARKASMPSCPPLAVTTAWPSASNASRSDLISSGSSSTLRMRRRGGMASGPDGLSLGRGRCGHREPKANRSSLPDRALDFDVRVMPPRHPVNHGEAEAGAALALGGEERLQATAAGLLVHSHARVRHLDIYLLRRCAELSVVLVRMVSVPPSGMASTALKTRLISASRISLSIPATAGRFCRQVRSAIR